MREQIAEFLSQGYRAAQVAEFCSCSEAYISELMKDESFKEILREKMRINVQARIETKYNDLEEMTLKELKGQIGMCDVNNLTTVLKSIAQIKASARRPIVDSYSNPTLGLTLVFPQQQVPSLVTDHQNRVVAIGERSMVPMPATAVRKLFKQMDSENLTKDIARDGDDDDDDEEEDAPTATQSRIA